MFKSESLVFKTINKLLSITQQKFLCLWENSLFLQNIDKVIFALILGVFALSTFASSDAIGYLGLMVLFLTLVKTFLKPNEKIEPHIFEIFLLFFFLTIVISLAGSSLFYLSFKGFLKTFTYLGFYFSLVQFFKSNKDKIPFTIYLIAILAAIQGSIGIFQNFSHVGEISTWQDVSNINPEDVMTRVYGTLQPFNPNLFGGYLVATIPLLFGSIVFNLFDKNYKRAITFSVLSLITSFALVLSGCRGAYLGFVVILVCFFGFLAKFIWKDLEINTERFKKIYLSFLTFMIAFATGLVLFVSSIRTRVFSIFAMRNDSSTSFRMNVYESAFNMFKDNWLLGIGVGNQNFREIYGLYMRTGFDALSAYSVYLEIAVESGIFALLAFIAFLVSLLVSGFKFVLRSTDLKSSLIVAISITSVLAVLVHGFVDTVFFRPQLQFVFWTTIAFASAIIVPAE